MFRVRFDITCIYKYELPILVFLLSLQTGQALILVMVIQGLRNIQIITNDSLTIPCIFKAVEPNGSGLLNRRFS